MCSTYFAIVFFISWGEGGRTDVHQESIKHWAELGIEIKRNSAVDSEAPTVYTKRSTADFQEVLNAWLWSAGFFSKEDFPSASGN